MTKNRKYNKYDVFIFVLIASLAAGNLFGALQVPRILAMAFSLPCASAFSTTNRKELSSIITCAVLFIAYSFISCLWTPAGFYEGFIAAFYNVAHLLLYFDIIVFSAKAHNPIKAIVFGFLVAFFITAIIAFWELATDQHLSVGKRDEAKAGKVDGEVYIRYFAAATFYNLNTYVTYLCFLFPFIFYGSNNRKYKKIIRALSLIAMTMLVILVLFNGSRGGVLAIGVMAFVYFFYSVFKLKKFNFIIVLFIVAVGFLLYYYGSVILNTLIVRSSLQGTFQEESRFVIWGNVFKVIGEYFGIGCGAGGLEYAMEKYARGGITVAHNVFLELFSEYGFFFFIVFVVALLNLLRRTKHVSDENKQICLYQAILTFPIIGIINSGYLTQPTLWAFLASLYCFAYRESGVIKE